jgi:hypothetical protein
MLCAAVATEAQEQSCNLKLSQLPAAAELYGFRLAMTPEEAKAKVPLIIFGGADAFGVMKTSINPSFDPRFDQAAFAGVRTISLDFLDGRLVTLWIGYDERFKWQTVDDFIAGISKSLNLSAPWTAKRGGKELTCDGFSIFVSMIARSPSIRITEDAAQETIARRREEAAAAAEAAVVGDRQTKNYYPSGCEAAEVVPMTNRVTFKDKDEAEKAGYKLAKDCQ